MSESCCFRKLKSIIVTLIKAVDVKIEVKGFELGNLRNLDSDWRKILNCVLRQVFVNRCLFSFF